MLLIPFYEISPALIQAAIWGGSAVAPSLLRKKDMRKLSPKEKKQLLINASTGAAAGFLSSLVPYLYKNDKD